ncbi:MAG TPA: polysaccharide biosynthesis/export family protein [Bryobacteraceae bacterium]|nr:polysaccharide biosynthesis/export family protein [Bryobacteraceae bacterium]
MTKTVLIESLKQNRCAIFGFHLFTLMLVITAAGNAQNSSPEATARNVRQPAQQSTPATDGRPEGRDLIIGPEDTLTIVLLDSEELSKNWRVGATGELNLPFVGRMNVAGMRVEDFERELGLKLRRYYKSPQLTVFVSEFRSQPITVTGAVEKPGTTQLEGTRTLFEAIMRAGGPKNAGPQVSLTRPIARGPIPWPTTKKDGEGYSVATLQFAEVMDGRSAAANLMVQPYDVINLQEGKEQRLVHIIGEVNKPGAIELATQDTVSLVKALAIAGGLSHGASAGHTKIMHVGPDGSRGTPADVNLKMILSGKALDLELTPGDVVIVPPARTLKTAAQSLAMTAASTSIWVVLATL